MKEGMICGFLALFLIALMGTPALFAEEEFEKVYAQADEGGSDPSAFEGDTGSMPGERAPENMPMADEPVDAGMGVQ